MQQVESVADDGLRIVCGTGQGYVSGQRGKIREFEFEGDGSALVPPFA